LQKAFAVMLLLLFRFFSLPALFPINSPAWGGKQTIFPQHRDRARQDGCLCLHQMWPPLCSAAAAAVAVAAAAAPNRTNKAINANSIGAASAQLARRLFRPPRMKREVEAGRRKELQPQTTCSLLQAIRTAVRGLAHTHTHTHTHTSAVHKTAL